MEELKNEITPPAAAVPASKKPMQETTPDTRPLQTVSLEDILEKIRRNYLNFKTLQSGTTLSFANPETAASQNCEAHLLYERPGKLFVRAYKELVPDFFTLAAYDNEFWFHVPRYNTVYTGSLERLGSSRGFEMQLDPVLLERSFLPAPLETGDTARMEELKPSYYLISILGKNGGLTILKRKLWVERKDLSVEREIYFSTQGIPEAEFIRKNYSVSIDLYFPHRIEFRKTKKAKWYRLI